MQKFCAPQEAERPTGLSTRLAVVPADHSFSTIHGGAAASSTRLETQPIQTAEPRIEVYWRQESTSLGTSLLDVLQTGLRYLCAGDVQRRLDLLSCSFSPRRQTSVKRAKLLACESRRFWRNQTGPPLIRLHLQFNASSSTPSSGVCCGAFGSQFLSNCLLAATTNSSSSSFGSFVSALGVECILPSMDPLVTVCGKFGASFGLCEKLELSLSPLTCVDLGPPIFVEVSLSQI